MANGMCCPLGVLKLPRVLGGQPGRGGFLPQSTQLAGSTLRPCAFWVSLGHQGLRAWLEKGAQSVWSIIDVVCSFAE